MTLIDRFVALAQVDTRRLDLERRIAKAPTLIQQEEARVQAARAAVAKNKEDGKRAGLETKRLEAELKAKQADLEKTQIAQNQAKQNEEYKVLGKKIDTLKAEIGALETRILEEYEAGDRRAVELAEHEKAAKVVEVEAAAARKKIEAELVTLKADLEKVRAERAAATQGIEKDQLAIYTNVLNEHGATAVATVDGNVCGGCFITLRPNQVSMLKSREQLVTCWQCNRILAIA